MTTLLRPRPRNLAQVRDPDGPDGYPLDVLKGETALILFAAAWHGRQDAYWIAEAGLRGTCVDTDERRLAEMRAIYPADWEFICEDAFKFAQARYMSGLRVGRPDQWDIVSLDPFTNLFDRCAKSVDLWRALARRAIILGTGHETEVEAPEDWAVTDVRHRSDFDGGVYWTVLEPK